MFKSDQRNQGDRKSERTFNPTLWSTFILLAEDKATDDDRRVE